MDPPPPHDRVRERDYGRGLPPGYPFSLLAEKGDGYRLTRPQWYRSLLFQVTLICGYIDSIILQVVS